MKKILYVYVRSIVNYAMIYIYLKVENAEFHGVSNENEFVHIIKYKWKDLSMCIEKA